MPKTVWDKLIVALDLIKEKEIKRVVSELSPKVKKFKIGLVPYLALGPKIIHWIRKKGADAFLDLKFFDIPNTMAEAGKVVLDLGVWAFTVHIKSGEPSLKILNDRLKVEAKKRGVRSPLIFGVTELTSKRASLDSVLRLARIASQSSLNGVVCSVWEARKIKNSFGLIVVTPGIRKKRGDDQKRIATVADALREGSDYFVVGRPIIGEKDYLKAAKDILGV